MLEDLRSLLGDTPELEFVDAFVRKTRLLVKTSYARRAEPLLPLWVVERLVASELMPAARLTVLRAGDVVPADAFRNAEGRVRRDALDALIEGGVSFIIADVEDDVPEIAKLSAALSSRLHHTVWANAYVTHGAGGALAPHYDDHDVLVLQVHGAKRWFTHGAPVTLPVTPSPDDVEFGPPQWDGLVEAGDVLFLPRGEVHHTELVTTPSVHLTFGIDTKRGVDFAKSLIDDLEEELLFREDLTLLGGEDALREKERLLKERLHARIDAAAVSAFLGSPSPKRR